MSESHRHSQSQSWELSSICCGHQSSLHLDHYNPLLLPTVATSFWKHRTVLCVSSVGFHSSWLPRRSVSRTFLNRLPLLSVRDCCSPAKVDTMSEDETLHREELNTSDCSSQSPLISILTRPPSAVKYKQSQCWILDHRNFSRYYHITRLGLNFVLSLECTYTDLTLNH